MSKLIAVYVGVDGLGIVGQLTSFVNIVLLFSVFGMSTGVTKYVAEYKESEQLKYFVCTANLLIIISCLITSFILIFFSKPISHLIFFNEAYHFFISMLGWSITLFAANRYLLSYINGLKLFKKYNYINVISNIVVLLYSALLIYFFKLDGALFAVVSSQSFIFIISIILAYKNFRYLLSVGVKFVQMKKFKMYMKYSLNTFVSTASLPICQMMIREKITNSISITATGLWESMNRISNIYMLFLTTALMTYYLPRLSEINSDSLLRKEIFGISKFVVPLVAISLLALFLLRELVIKILFTSEFYDVLILFPYQIIGDFLKSIAWLLAFVLIAKGRTVTNVLLNLVIYVFYYIAIIFFVERLGFVGASTAYFITYLVYFILVVFIFRKLLILKVE